jgi:NAD/NADP transhydrogenase beta subunit
MVRTAIAFDRPADQASGDDASAHAQERSRHPALAGPPADVLTGVLKSPESPSMASGYAGIDNPLF